MHANDARRLLELLALGIDPTTEQPLPSDHLLHSPPLIRALFLGAAALARKSWQADAAAEPAPQAGRTWSTDDDARLIAQFEAGTQIANLAEQLGRTQRAIAARLVRLGKIQDRREVLRDDA
ncbi:MAG: hypothetical protein U0939_14880 [Pirellulales bacterium]